MKKIGTTLALYMLINVALNAQDCKVSMETLQGTYTGGCEGGKANGQGKATGTDTYEGMFKNGYPEGVGTYTWANKSSFQGIFKKGLREGEGKMTYTTGGKVDSTVSGFWKKDKYVGLYEKPVVVLNTTNKINKVNCRLSKKGGDGTIMITTTQIGTQDGDNSFSGTQAAVKSITDVVVVKGLYIRKNNQVLVNSTIHTIQQIQFPFQAIFYYSNGEYFEVSFREQGDYDVSVGLQ